MKLNRILSLFFPLLVSFAVCACSERRQDKIIKMPNVAILQKRLNEEGFQHFVENTRIIELLADQEKKALGVVMIVDCALYGYDKNLGQLVISETVSMRRSHLLEVVLQDHPDALQELADKGLYQNRNEKSSF